MQKILLMKFQTKITPLARQLELRLHLKAGGTGAPMSGSVSTSRSSRITTRFIL